MAKLKKKKKVKKSSGSASVISKSRPKETKSNPFEIRTNRRKYDVLGQKRERGEMGRPGVSRSRAIEKRNKTLLKEYRERRKTNLLIDKRLAKEHIPEEERELERYLLETKRRHEKSGLFNLEENEEELTHLGQSLGDHLDDVIIESDNENDVDDTEDHFGGFFRKKDQSEDETYKTRKEIMNEVASKSKLHKYERQQERERIEDLMETVDNQWKDIHGLMNRSEQGHSSDKSVDNDYDRYVVELAREPRGKACDRLKTDEEMAKEEKERLEVLEAERIRRMKSTAKSTDNHHRSVDDDTRLVAKEDKRVMIQYRDGELVLPNGEKSLLPTRTSKEETSDGSCSEDDEEIEEEIDEEIEGETMGDNDYSDGDSDIDDDGDMIISSEENVNMTDNDIPFTFKDVPTNVQELSLLLDSKTPLQCAIIVERIISCHHHALSPDNKTAMTSFMSVLLGYCLSVEDVMIIEELVQCLFKLSQIDPYQTSLCFHKTLKHIINSFNRNKSIIQLPDLIFFKLVSVIFPSSDYRHPIVTPCLHIMSSSLTKRWLSCSLNGVCMGLCMCKIILEYISDTHRYIPELAMYLTQTLHYFCDSNVISFTLPFSNAYKQSLSLFTFNDGDVNILNPLQILTTTPHNDIIKYSLLHMCLQLVHAMSQQWQTIPSADAIFTPLLNIIDNIFIPDGLTELVGVVKVSLGNGISQSKPILQLLRRKPKSINFLEPQFDQDYQPGKRKNRNKLAAEKMKLRHKHKRELKGAIREIRKDNKYLAKEKLREQLARDTERKRKVKQIQSWLQEERHDQKKEKLKKKK
jgi:nucleolar protein 14